MSADKDNDRRQTTPRALLEEFDGLKPAQPIAYESPEQRSEHARKASRTRWAQFREEDDRKAGPRRQD
jgi:hypothetical protein